MEIREIGPEALPTLSKGAEAFYASSRFLKGFKLDLFCKVWTGLLNSGTGVIFALVDGLDVVGAIGGVKYADLYSGELIGVEFFWFVLPEHRGRGFDLYYRFESWARAQACAQIRMTHLCDLMPDGIKHVYEEIGFEAIEVTYAKELK